MRWTKGVGVGFCQVIICEGNGVGRVEVRFLVLLIIDFQGLDSNLLVLC